jgi:L-arabinose isomerase
MNMLPSLEEFELWFLTGSQHLYGPEALKQVAVNSQQLVKALNDSGRIPSRIVFKNVQTTPEEIRATCLEATHDTKCIGVILWMHTFSPSKMWINGLKALQKPILHLHTQFNRDLPWSTIDMDFMNLNQAAHGDREAGYIHTRMRLNRKVVVGHWSEKDVQDRIGVWSRAAAAWADLQGARFCRIGDNMRFVAVTEGDKTAAESKFGYSVNTHGVGDLVKYVNDVSDAAITQLVADYEKQYAVSPDLKKGKSRHDSVREAARIELGLRAFLEGGNFKGFTTTFEDLHGLRQLPGIAPQRLMNEGYGFAAEGDWKTAALLRAMKVMASGLKGGTSFMEDYTYHLDPKNQLVLGSHMLEICPSIASAKPKLEVHPLGIGGKEDPARLVFDAPAGAALTCSMIDLGNRLRLVLNEVDVVAPPKPLPKLPVARAVWKCRPDFKTGCAAWIYAGGAHHSGFSYAVTAEHLSDFADIAGVELVKIDANTELENFRRELKFSEVYYHLANGFQGM